MGHATLKREKMTHKFYLLLCLYERMIIDLYFPFFCFVIHVCVCVFSPFLVGFVVIVVCACSLYIYVCMYVCTSVNFFR